LKKKRRQLYFLFWVVTFFCFASLLGWYLIDQFKKSPSEPRSFLEEPSNAVQVIEQKDAHPEEVRPLPDISPEELAFRERAARILEDFPRKSILKDRGRNPHKPPRELVDASGELGALEDLLDKNPGLVKEGLRFYRKCALTNELLTSLRGLCLHNLKTRARSAGFENRIRWNEFPDHLHRIADKL